MTRESIFARGLADAIKRSKDPRFQVVLAWCMKTIQDMGFCGGDPDKQELHAAVVAWELLLGIGELEDSLGAEVMEVAKTSTCWNETDTHGPKYELLIDFNQKTITVTATFVCFGTIVLPINMTTEKQVVVDPLVLPLSEFAQARLEAQKEPT